MPNNSYRFEDLRIASLEMEFLLPCGCPDGSCKSPDSSAEPTESITSFSKYDQAGWLLQRAANALHGG